MGAAGHWKCFVGHVYKYAVFDIKPTYNHQIFIPKAQSHSTKIHFAGEAVGEPD